MGSEYGPAVDMFVAPSRVFIGAKPRGAIVIHKTAGFNDAFSVARYFQTNSEMVSSHFVVGLDGTVVQCVSLNDGAAANCCLTSGYDPYWNQYLGLYPGNNMNYCTISIEHVDNHRNASGIYDNQGVPPQAQIDASIALCLWLRDNFDMQAADIKTHASIDPVNRQYCPGNYPMDLLIATIQQKKANDMIPVLDSTKKLSGYQLSQAQDIWGDAAMWESGICALWQCMYANGYNPGSPKDKEKESKDWQGNPIVYREFSMGVRIEWSGSSGRVFTLTQEVHFS